jgi:hypothetical protein
LLLGYLAIPIGVIYLLSYVQPAYMNSRHLMLITPAFYLLVGSGLAAWRGRTAVITLVVSVVMLGGIAYSTYNYFGNSAYDKDHHREWGEYLREHVRPGDVIVINPPHISDLYEYYADSGVPWVGLPMFGDSQEATVARLEELLTDYDRVWLAMSHTPPWGDLRRVVQKWLTNNAFRIDLESFKSYASIVQVAAFQRDWPSFEELPADAEEVGVSFGPALRLLGYRPLTDAEPGEPLHVELFWAVDEPIEQEASVALRLVDRKGHVWGQNEECPFDGLYPMWQWAEGLQLPSEHQLTVSHGTPPGEYYLEMVLVSRPSEDGCLGERGSPIIPLSADSDRLRGDKVQLGTVEVQRSESAPTDDELGIENPLRVRFDGLELLGADLAPEELVAGGRIDVDLFWELHEPQPKTVLFRLRLMDPTGRIVQEKMIHPSSEVFPTNDWLVGDRFRGQFWLSTPEEGPGGSYVVELLPEPPLRRTGFLEAIGWRQELDDPIRLGGVEVQHSQAGEPVRTRVAAIPTPDNLVAEYPMYARLGDSLRLLGFDAHPTTARPGDTVDLTLYWQALRPMNLSYSVFTHLVDGSNEIVAQDDGLPQQGGYPTTLWRPGEVVADAYSVSIPPGTSPGVHVLRAGMYRLDTETRLPAIDASGLPVANASIALLQIRVEAPATPEAFEIDMRPGAFLPVVTKGR